MPWSRDYMLLFWPASAAASQTLNVYSRWVSWVYSGFRYNKTLQRDGYCICRISSCHRPGPNALRGHSTCTAKGRLRRRQL
ncbi:hypothetical protein QBC44DRAFT_328727 [Cladorrhinum sp. PSN332]|nr:hypothetical protein QBC44DRAFT_328727 [Cladorrhinum sp. PSN332]